MYDLTWHNYTHQSQPPPPSPPSNDILQPQLWKQHQFEIILNPTRKFNCCLVAVVKTLFPFHIILSCVYWDKAPEFNFFLKRTTCLLVVESLELPSEMGAGSEHLIRNLTLYYLTYLQHCQCDRYVCIPLSLNVHIPGRLIQSSSGACLGVSWIAGPCCR